MIHTARRDVARQFWIASFLNSALLATAVQYMSADWSSAQTSENASIHAGAENVEHKYFSYLLSCLQIADSAAICVRRQQRSFRSSSDRSTAEVCHSRR